MVGFEALRYGRHFLLGLQQSYARLQPHVRFNPLRTAVFQFVAAAFKGFLHRYRNPELHRPAHEGPIKSLRRDAHNRVQHAIEPLRFPDDLWVALESSLPQLIADHRHRMRVAPHFFLWVETAAENGMDADGIEIIRGYDASGRDLGAVADTERAARDFGYDEGVDQRATLAQIHKVGPGCKSASSLPGGSPPEGHQPFLVSDHRVRAEKYSLDPTEHRCIWAVSGGEAK